jgi:hypothetical protein
VLQDDSAGFAMPLPQKTGNGHGHGMPAVVGEGAGAAVSYAKKVSPAVAKRLADICFTSPNHAAARASGRDLLQLAGLLTERHDVNILVSFRALFQQMTVQELDGFMAKKEFPERLRAEAMKLLEHTA